MKLNTHTIIHMSELDTEWMKFMTRISRQQNCENVDDSSCGEEDEISLSSSVLPGSVASVASAVVIPLSASQPIQTITPPSMTVQVKR